MIELTNKSSIQGLSQLAMDVTLAHKLSPVVWLVALLWLAACANRTLGTQIDPALRAWL